jgi:hypothetical protein
MEFTLKIITLSIGILNFIGIILVGIFHKLTSDKLTGNDLHHLSLDVKEIKDEQKCMKEKLIEVSMDVAKLKGKLE